MSAAISPLEQHFGPMSPDSPWYVTRDADSEVLNYFKQGGISVALRGPRQVGKTSLALRVCDQLQAQGWQIVVLDVREDFAIFDLASGHGFLKRLAQKILQQLGIESAALAAFDEDRTAAAFSSFMERLGRELEGTSLLLMLDRLDALAEATACATAVAGLRGHHTRQSELGSRAWARLLVTHTLTPQRGYEGSIFKVAKAVPLADFTPREVQRLVTLYSQVSGVDIPAMHRLLEGHPVLCRLALNAMAERRVTMAELLEVRTACKRVLKSHMDALAEPFDELLSAAFRDLANGQPLPSPFEYEALLSLGVLKDTKWQKPEIRCELYRHWLPDLLA